MGVKACTHIDSLYKEHYQVLDVKEEGCICAVSLDIKYKKYVIPGSSYRSGNSSQFMQMHA